MEDDKLAAYYDELTRKGGGAARFKQGLGFTSSSNNDAIPARGSALPSTTSSSSFLGSFVRASSPSKTSQFEKQAQLQSIQNKLTKKPQNSTSRNRSRSRSRSPIRSRSRDRYSRKHRSRSRSRDRRSRHKHRSRSRSRSRSRERRKKERSPEKGKKRGEVRNGGGEIDFAKLIEGYANMTPAERVKAKMKIQLSRTAENDETIGKGSGWERFDFDKDAPLDDEEIEAVEDDAVLVKHIGQSFRFAAVEVLYTPFIFLPFIHLCFKNSSLRTLLSTLLKARNEEKIKAAHDEAMFGAYSYAPPTETDDEAEEESNRKQNIESAPPPVTNLLSNQVLTKQQGSWRDRARKP
ncbi:hypothetical protein ACJIZ3_005236 [Penstemon smallii]|uniref:Uncharacterized protein n=1 Tax=Penstemon smallii TaxID=265156 RepID=A0ABD3S4C1_9LAMI